MYGGIDLGGTKIEACLHDDRFSPVGSQRVATPGSYLDLLDALVGQVAWLRAKAGDDALPIGIGVPGLVDQSTGLAFTANLDAIARPLTVDLAKRIGEVLPFENDCKCFALSEANGGAASEASSMFGLIIGTGVGGGVCIDGHLVKGWSGLPGEIGHIALPARVLNELNLPVLKCGCGRWGCYETYLSGPGLSRIAASITGVPVSGEAINERLSAGDSKMERLVQAWAQIAAELILAIQLTIDPECIVLGGGVTRLPNIAERITSEFVKVKLPTTRTPSIKCARFGDSSGVRGAAMLAHQSLQSRTTNELA
jgi:predicted NBD/HSP70 family sugar kinase